MFWFFFIFFPCKCFEYESLSLSESVSSGLFLWILEVVVGGCAFWMHTALPFQSVGVMGMHSMRAWQLTLLQYLDQSYVFRLECSSALDLEVTECSYALVSSLRDSKILLCHLPCFSQDTTLAFLYPLWPGCSQFQTVTVSDVIHSSSKQLAYRNVESKCVLRPHL